MKWAIAVLIVAVSGCMTAITYVNVANDDRASFASAASKIGVAFSVPSDASDPRLVSDALSSASSQTATNVFRSVVGATPDGHASITQFILLASDQTRLYESFRLAKGHFPTAAELRTGVIATTNYSRSGAAGYLATLDPGDTISLAPLSAAFDLLPAPGTYFMECSRLKCGDFLNALAGQLGTRPDGTKYQGTDFSTTSTDIVVATNTAPYLLTALVGLSIILIALLAIFRQLHEAKRSAILRLHGTSSSMAWWHVSGRWILGFALGSSAASILAATIASGFDTRLIAATMSSGSILTVVLVGATASCIPYIARLRMTDALKSRRDTRSLFGLSAALSVMCAVAVIVVGEGAISNLSAIDTSRSALRFWENTSGYGVFAPVSNGNDVVELQNGQLGATAQEATTLYSALAAEGALFVYAGAYQPSSTSQPLAPGSYRSMQVNPAFLERYPIIDEHGQVVSVTDSTSDWVVLVPASRRNEEQQIRSYFSSQRQSAAQGQLALFHEPAPQQVAQQKIDIIWIKSSQEVFTFNPTVPNNGIVVDPIVEVMTSTNSVGIDRLNAVTGDATAGLKVPLVNGSSSATLSTLSALLTKTRLADNLQHLVTINEYQNAQIAKLQSSLINTLLTVAGLGLLLIVAVAQLSTVAFERFSRQIAIRGLFGIRLRHRFRELAILGVVCWSAQGVVAYSLVSIGLRPFSYGDLGPAPTVVLVFAVAAIEAVAGLTIVLAVERRRIPAILKSEF